MSADTPRGGDGDSAEASFRQGWQEVLAGRTRSVSELWEGIEPTPTLETRQALEDAQTRQNLASFADLEELYEDLRVEAAHLLCSPTNIERLLTALARAQAGTTEPQSLDELRRDVGLESDTGSVRRPNRGKTRDMTTNLPD